MFSHLVSMVGGYPACSVSPIGSFQGGDCIITLSSTALTISLPDNHHLATWDYSTIRNFSCSSTLFCFTSGRRGPFGLQEYNFKMSTSTMLSLISALSTTTGVNILMASSASADGHCDGLCAADVPPTSPSLGALNQNDVTSTDVQPSSSLSSACIPSWTMMDINAAGGGQPNPPKQRHSWMRAPRKYEKIADRPPCPVLPGSTDCTARNTPTLHCDTPSPSFSDSSTQHCKSIKSPDPFSHLSPPSPANQLPPYPGTTPPLDYEIARPISSKLRLGPSSPPRDQPIGVDITTAGEQLTTIAPCDAQMMRASSTYEEITNLPCHLPGSKNMAIDLQESNHPLLFDIPSKSFNSAMCAEGVRSPVPLLPSTSPPAVNELALTSEPAHNTVLPRYYEVPLPRRSTSLRASKYNLAGSNFPSLPLTQEATAPTCTTDPKIHPVTDLEEHPVKLLNAESEADVAVQHGVHPQHAYSQHTSPFAYPMAYPPRRSSPLPGYNNSAVLSSPQVGNKDRCEVPTPWSDQHFVSWGRAPSSEDWIPEHKKALKKVMSMVTL